MFLGWDLGPGLRWTQIYRFLDYESLQKGVFQEVTSRELVLPGRPWKFPLADARDEAMAVFDKQDFPTLCSGLPEVASEPSKPLPSAEPDAVDSDKQHPSPSEAAIQDGGPVEAAPEGDAPDVDSRAAAESAVSTGGSSASQPSPVAAEDGGGPRTSAGNRRKRYK